MNKLTEYWTWERSKSWVRSVYFVFVRIKSLLIDSHSAGLCNLNPLSIARACPLFLHMCAVLEMRRGRKVDSSGIDLPDDQHIGEVKEVSHRYLQHFTVGPNPQY